MSYFYDESRPQGRAPIMADPYGRGYAMVPGPFDERDFVRDGPGWGGPMGPPMPFYGGGGGGMGFYGGGAFPPGFHGRPEHWESRSFGSGRPGATMRSGYGGNHESGPPRDPQFWERKERLRGGSLVDFPPDPDVRGFDEYKRRWDEVDRNARFDDQEVAGWGPEPEVKYDPLLMWSVTPDESTPQTKVKAEPAIKPEPVGYSFSDYHAGTQERHNRFESSDAHVPPAYDEQTDTDIPPPAAAVGTHGRANDQRERSISPPPPARSEYDDDFDLQAYKRRTRYDDDY
ncbi:hypothetical protein DFJ77DRAFT_474601 [Powellomyces hirtus]|nr:hypothetical protein DFJ77DRAFT_474601 [Powellomyces hirtus]